MVRFFLRNHLSVAMVCFSASTLAAAVILAGLERKTTYSSQPPLATTSLIMHSFVHDGGATNATSSSATPLAEAKYVLTNLIEESDVGAVSSVSSPKPPQTSSSSVASPSSVLRLTPRPELSAENCDSLRESFEIYPEPKVQAIRIERDMRARNPATAALLREIACIPHPTWLVGGDVRVIADEVRLRIAGAALHKKTSVFVLYNLPHVSEARFQSDIRNGTYLEWVEAVARGIGEYPAWVVIEPDALPMSYRLPLPARQERLEVLKRAIGTLRAHAPNARLYLDAGHSKWLSPEAAAVLLKQAGILTADGFSLNIANYQTTESQILYGSTLSSLVGGKHFIIDTSRNGNGPTEHHEWCNAPDRALGPLPMFETGVNGLDALLWVKPPGESDGFCNGGPKAGDFWVDYATALVRNRP